MSSREAAEWTDHHCHLDDTTYVDLVAEAHRAGVTRLVDVGTDLASSRAALGRAQSTSGLWATAGVHPHHASDGIDGVVDLLAETEVVAVGECGLDYHHDRSPRAQQRRVFAEHIALAHETGLPLVVHSREAWDDTLDVLDGEGVPERTVIHCFTGGPVEARLVLQRGCHLSFSGIVTFKAAPEVREAAQMCPADRLLVETDAPYLTPAPHRGKENRPSWVVDVGAGLAEARGEELGDIARTTHANAATLYDL